MYDVTYLPLARQDMADIVRYVSRNLDNPQAAGRLAKQFVDAIDRLAEFPYSAMAYHPIRPLHHEYRKLTVKNYCVFYWVDEEKKQVTVARVIYGKRSVNRVLE